MKYLSNPIGELKASYDVVVIGSGYGGGISASRLSRAGRKVCVLERGKEFQAGDFPNDLKGASKEMQTRTAKRHIGPKTGLYDLHIHEGMSVLVGCGLGGTSLINANVSITPEERVMDDSCWPKEIREEFKDPSSPLSRGYERARDMLKPNQLPDHIQLNKLITLQKSAEANGEKFYRTDINVNFDVDGLNHVGVKQKPCNLCGDCCSGCNYSAKNTIMMNYLPDAKSHGAEIFTETEVSHIEKNGDKWLIHYRHVGAKEEKFDAPTAFIEADIVVLSAGTLGSTEIMLRSKERGLNVSDKVGERFSGNGDVLGFAYNTKEIVDGVGAGTHQTEDGHDAGPCITGIIDNRYKENLNDGMIIEDAAIPGALSPLLPITLNAQARKIGVDERQEEDKGKKDTLSQKKQALDSDIHGAYTGAIQNTQTYLLMAHDGEAGRIELKEDKLNIDWSTVGKEPIFEMADAQLRKETLPLSGTYIKNPIWTEEMNNELITVHPLGGCYMGESIDSAVVNHKGQVFTNNDSKGVYENFYITDGSVVARSLGVNPLITISAISERCCELMISDRGWEIDYGFHKMMQAASIPDEEKTIGVEFTETMRGFFTKGIQDDDYQKGFDEGEKSDEEIKFTLVIRGEDVDEMVSSPEHQAQINGTVTAPGLSANPMNVSEGIFNLFVEDPDSVNRRFMKYSMCLTSTEGKKYCFKGFKNVHYDKRFEQWSDTSTLFITIFDGPNDSGPIIAQGIQHILPKDFAKQMTTMKAVNAPNKKEGLKAVSKFAAYFTKSIAQVYGNILAPITFQDKTAPPREKRTLKLCDPEYYPVETEDGLNLLLTRYNGGTKGPILMMHGVAGNRLTFNIDTVETNVVEYFYEEGYDIWLYDYRLSNYMPYIKNQHTVDAIAKYDWPAAIDVVKTIAEVDEIDILAHCVGSMSIFMALSQGLTGVRSVLSSQIASDFHAAPQVRWKSYLRVPKILSLFGVEYLSATADVNESWLLRLYDKIVGIYASWAAGKCTDASCHRMTFMFGPLYQHANLNHDSHRAMIEMFTIANMTTYKQLTRMIRRHQLLDADGNDVYMPHLDKLNIPITFIHGEKNQLFQPKSTLKTYNKLCELNGSNLYKRHVIEGYGHNDCLYGKNAITDVYPKLLEHFEQFYKA